MTLVIGHDEEIAHWMSQQTGFEFELHYRKDGTPAQAVLGWVNARGELVSAALFNNFHEGGSIETHFCGKVSRECVRGVFRYAFVQLNVMCMIAKPFRSNKSAQKIIKKLGGVFQTTLNNTYGPSRGDAAVIFRIDREAARKWI